MAEYNKELENQIERVFRAAKSNAELITIPDWLPTPNAGKRGKVVFTGQPNGFPKTDVYIGIGVDSDEITDSLNISIKSDSTDGKNHEADFVENWVKPPVLDAIFGDAAPTIITECVDAVGGSKSFVTRAVSNFNNTKNGSFPLGWVLQLGLKPKSDGDTLQNPGGDLNDIPSYKSIKNKAMYEAFAGGRYKNKQHIMTSIDGEEAIQMVGGGVANCMLHYGLSTANNASAQEIVDALTPIPATAEDKGNVKLYYSFKRANYPDGCSASQTFMVGIVWQATSDRKALTPKCAIWGNNNDIPLTFGELGNNLVNEIGKLEEGINSYNDFCAAVTEAYNNGTIEDIIRVEA